jgi:asparagine synthase (glutamine-hydrolysing)
VSVQFGRWNFDGRPTDKEYLAKAEAMLAPHGPDGGGTYIKDGVGILFRVFHTNKDSRKEIQPFVTPSGAVLCWDGRLDNRAELINGLKDFLTAEATDVEIVAVAYEQWGTECFAKLIGDWALAIWSPSSRSVLLAKDFVGTRQLYYSIEKDQITWSTILDPLVLLAGKTLALEEEYIAGWLSFFPATHLTPYVGIHSVPPSCFVRLDAGQNTIRKYWNFDSSKKLRYRTDGEYEGHFRCVFAEAVRRRLRSDSPILAELSGGMDSSSIVCMADRILASGGAETSRVDTISYYDDSEPNWNERPYVTKVEEKRGRSGCHINLDSGGILKSAMSDARFCARPGFAGRPSEANAQFACCLSSQGNRVVLSGIGGDEFTGGVPTPIPQLEDFLARAQFGPLAHQLKIWALIKRKPWFQLLFEAARRFFPPSLAGVPQARRPASWLNPDFIKWNRRALEGYETRVKFCGPLPSFQENIFTLDVLRRQLECEALQFAPPCEKRYPYLDRCLIEFLFAIPREQLVRPGQRRSLMRRALAGVVPQELLDRKRKAFVARAPMTAISGEYESLVAMGQNLASSFLGIVDAQAFQEILRQVRSGREVPIVPLVRTIALEAWLRDLRDSRALGPIASAANGASFEPRSPLKIKGATRRRTAHGRAPLGDEKLVNRVNCPQSRRLMKSGAAPTTFVLTLLFAAALLLGAAAEPRVQSRQSEQTQSTSPANASPGTGRKVETSAAHKHAYHSEPAKGPLPSTLDPVQFANKKTVFVAYCLAARLKDVLYQMPCYCPCDKREGHASLLDCYTSKHGTACKICQMEVIVAYTQSKAGKTAAEIREAMEQGDVFKFGLSKYVEEHYGEFSQPAPQ